VRLLGELLHEALMEVRYTTTIDDYVACCERMLWRSPSVRKRFALNWAVPTLAGLGGAALLGSEYPACCIGLIAASLIHAVTFPMLAPERAERGIRRAIEEAGTRGLCGPATLLLTEDSLTVQSETAESTVKWRDMNGVEVVGEVINLHISGLQIVVIPRHGMENPECYPALRDYLVERLPKIP
jgi:hypothetical protein